MVYMNSANRRKSAQFIPKNHVYYNCLKGLKIIPAGIVQKKYIGPPTRRPGGRIQYPLQN